jgi:uncharacterized GH25 family protein
VEGWAPGEVILRSGEANIMRRGFSDQSAITCPRRPGPAVSAGASVGGLHKTFGRVNLVLGSKMRRVIFVTVGMLSTSAAFAHDFWLATSRWHVAPGATVVVTANVGDDIYPRSENVTAPERVESLRLVGSTTAVLTPRFRTMDKSLAADVTLPAAPATYMAVMVVKGRLLSMEGDKFIEYLKEEGLDRLVDEVNRRGESQKKSRERYWRDAKVLIRAGDGPSDQVAQPLGLAAELVPDRDLTKAKVGDTIGVRLLSEGKPVVGAQVSLTAAAPGPIKSRVTRARTDAEGRARLTIAKRGPYLLTAVHMLRREGDTGEQAFDWESYWCSLTFDVASRQGMK